VELEALSARVLHDEQRVVVQAVPRPHQVVQVRHQPRVRQHGPEGLAMRRRPSQKPSQVLRGVRGRAGGQIAGCRGSGRRELGIRV